jgi:hypothetical protein
LQKGLAIIGKIPDDGLLVEANPADVNFSLK